MGAPIPEPPSGVASSLEAVLAESRRIREDAAAERVAQRRFNRIMAGTVAGLLIVVLLLVGVAFQVKRTNDAIVSCTTPSGACAKQGKEQTGRAVGDILKASIYMAECARLHPGESGPAFDRFLERCVAEKLAASNASPAP